MLVLPISALRLGGVGGFELLTSTTNIIMVVVDNIGHTQCITWISFAVGTKIGVIAAPRIIPSNGANDKSMVANVR